MFKCDVLLLDKLCHGGAAHFDTVSAAHATQSPIPHSI